MDAYETRIYSAVLITAVFIVCLIVYFAFSVIRHQRKFVRLQRSYFLQEVSLLENERTRIARDLHDELGPLLSVTKMLISAIRGGDEKEAKHLGKANHNLEQLIHTLGEIAMNLTPTALLKKGLDFALYHFFEDVREASPIEVSFGYQIQTVIQPATGIHLYRIVREMVHNCLKHANATHLSVQLSERNGELHIRCQDNGKGFGIKQAMEASTGHGLQSIKSRTQMLGGVIRYQSDSSTGTTYFIKIPLHEKTTR